MKCKYLNKNNTCTNKHNQTGKCKFKDRYDYNNCYYSPCSDYLEQFKNK